MKIIYKFKSSKPLDREIIKNFDDKIKKFTKNDYTIYVKNTILLVSIPSYLLEGGVTKMVIAENIINFAADSNLSIELQK